LAHKNMKGLGATGRGYAGPFGRRSKAVLGVAPLPVTYCISVFGPEFRGVSRRLPGKTTNEIGWFLFAGISA